MLLPNTKTLFFKSMKYNNSLDKNLFFEKLDEIQMMYEKLVFEISMFPKSSDTSNHDLIEMVDVLGNTWISLPFAPKKFINRVLDILYRASEYCFQLPKIYRLIFRLSVLVENKEEACLSLNTYMSIIDKSIQVKDPCFTSSTDSGTCINYDPLVLDKQHTNSKENLHCIIDTFCIGSNYFLKNSDTDNETSLKFAKFGYNLSDLYENQLENSTILRAIQTLALVYHFMGSDFKKTKRVESHLKCIELLEIAENIDPNNYNTLFLYSLRYAQAIDINMALLYLKRSLESDPKCINKAHLLVLLLSAKQEYAAALDVCTQVLESGEYESHQRKDSHYSEITYKEEPSQIDILNTRLTQNRLIHIIHGYDACFEHMNMLFTNFAKTYSDLEEHILIRNTHKKTLITKSSTRIKKQKTPSMSGNLSIRRLFQRNGSSISIDSTKPMQTPSKLDEELSSVNNKEIEFLAELWLLTSRDFEKNSQFKESFEAIEEVRKLTPKSSTAYYRLGESSILQNNIEEALEYFKKGLDLNSCCSECLTGLSQTHLIKNNIVMAEFYSQKAVYCGWNNKKAWFIMGKIFKLTNRNILAKKAFLYALYLEKNSPIVPFENLRKFGNFL